MVMIFFQKARERCLEFTGKAKAILAMPPNSLVNAREAYYVKYERTSFAIHRDHKAITF